MPRIVKIPHQDERERRGENERNKTLVNVERSFSIDFKSIVIWFRSAESGSFSETVGEMFHDNNDK